MAKSWRYEDEDTFTRGFTTEIECDECLRPIGSKGVVVSFGEFSEYVCRDCVNAFKTDDEDVEVMVL